MFGITNTQVTQAANLAQVVTQAVLQSPTVVNTPENKIPPTAEVKKVAEQVVTSIAPIVAPDVTPKMAQDIANSVAQTVVQSPEVKATAENIVVTPAVAQKIAEAVIVKVAPEAAQAETPIFITPTATSTMTPTELKSVESDVVRAISGGTQEDVARALQKVEQIQEPVTISPDLQQQMETKAAEDLVVRAISGGSEADVAAAIAAVTATTAPISAITSTATTAITSAITAAITSTVTSAITSAVTAPVATETGPTLARDVFVRTLSQFFPGADMNAPWMQELYSVISDYYKTGVPIDQAINLSLTDARKNPKLSTFADRFKGIYAIQDLKMAGRPVIVPTIAEYVRSESQVADLFNQAGLSDLANSQGIADILGKGKAVSQIANEINQVFRRIDLAPQSIKDTLSRFYPTVDRSRLARTILLGDRGLQELTDELAGLEVLSAAEQQGIAATGARGIVGGVTQERAQQLARSGITYGTALPKFAEVRRATPQEAKLAGISRRQSIGQAGVEEALLLGGAQEAEQMQLLAEEEAARFRGRSGRMEPGLASQRRANRAF
jgi:hypothetical protein